MAAGLYRLPGVPPEGALTTVGSEVMSTDDQLPNCPICGEHCLRREPGPRSMQTFSVVEYDCKRCGRFRIDIRFPPDTFPKLFDDVRHLISAWIRRQNKMGLVPLVGEGKDVYREEWLMGFRQMGFPESTGDKLNALLLAYADAANGDYKYAVSPNQPQLIAEVAAKSRDEIEGLSELLHQLGYLSPFVEYRGGPSITARGWLRVEDLRRTVNAGDSAFIAMWFDESTRAYRDAVAAAVERCHYRPVFVDQEEFSGFIMDQVISLIRSARFLIADFTSRPELPQDLGKVRRGVRGGIYWESGMAYGMGKAVIHTCEDSPESKSRIHFDIDQYNMIFWTPDELSQGIRALPEIKGKPNFAEKLVARIWQLAGGEGTYSRPG